MMMPEFVVRTPFRNVKQCIDVVNRLDDSILNEISDMIRSRFMDFMRHQYGESVVYDLHNLPVVIENNFVVLVDSRGVKWMLARICGADYELERTYRLVSPNHKPIYVSFESWIPEHCGVHCYYNVDKHTLTLMPMTAAILRFPEVIRARVEPL